MIEDAVHSDEFRTAKDAAFNVLPALTTSGVRVFASMSSTDDPTRFLFEFSVADKQVMRIGTGVRKIEAVR